jgi:tetratricopeptide (TPR) repeat protein
MTGHLFISYSRAYAVPFALQLADKVTIGPPPKAVWLDQRDERPGEDWDEQIVEAIRACSALLFVMTKDSVQPQSGCKDEWVRALKYKKPVIPLLAEAGAELPFRLGSRQWVDFTGAMEIGLAKLRDHLAWMDSPKGQLQQLNYRLIDAQRELGRPGVEQARVQEDIAELGRQIAHQTTVLEDPNAARERVEARVEHGLERERTPAKPARGTAKQARFVNPPPAVPPTWFQNRHVESGQIAGFLKDDGLRIMTVVGRGGIGKSAMVCRILKSLESGQLPDDLGRVAVDGILYLSNARSSHPVTLPELYQGLCRLLPEETAQAIETVQRNGRTRALMEALSEAFSRGRTIVLLDNFEDSLDSNGEIQSAELKEALRGLLELPFHGLKAIITTRALAMDLAQVEPGRQRVLTLDRGLEHPFAEEVLRAMDADGKVGLRDAPAALLAEARERTRGNPRALEHLYGILAADRDTTLKEILNDTRRLLPEQVVEVLVGEAFNRLDLPAQRVMQALATYRYPVPPEALDYLLKPYVTGIDSAPILKRLVNMQFARRESGRYYLHPVDRQYALGRIPQGKAQDKTAEPPVLSRLALTHRAAQWFKESRKSREDWKNLEDLAPQLAEFELRMDGEEYDGAAAVLQDISFDYLEEWGHYGLLIELQSRLKGRISDPLMEAGSVLSLGNAYRRVGQFSEAIACYERMLSLARENSNRGYEGAAMTGLGNIYIDLGVHDRAIEHNEAALAIDRELKNRAGEAIDLVNLASEYSGAGQVLKAIEDTRTALGIAREVHDARTEAAALVNLGDYYRNLGDRDAALRSLSQAYGMARDLGNLLVEMGALLFEGEVYFFGNDLARAAELFRAAIELADGSRAIQFQSLGRIRAGWVSLCRDDVSAAGERAQEATRFDYPLATHRAWLLRGAVELHRGDCASAREALQTSLRHCNEMLSRYSRNYDALDVKGLALCGLAICDNGPQIEAARAAFAAAREISSGAGDVKLLLQQFDALAKADSTGLMAPLRSVAAGIGPAATAG